MKLMKQTCLFKLVLPWLGLMAMFGLTIYQIAEFDAKCRRNQIVENPDIVPAVLHRGEQVLIPTFSDCGSEFTRAEVVSLLDHGMVEIKWSKGKFTRKNIVHYTMLFRSAQKTAEGPVYKPIVNHSVVPNK